MGRFTALDDGQIAAIAAAFGVGTVRRWRALDAGTINSNFALEAERGRFFLRVNEGKSEEDVRYEAELVGALARAGVATPEPLPSAGGQAWLPFEGRFLSLFPWVEGGHRAPHEVRPADAAAVGDALAALHLAGQPLAERFERDGIYTFGHIVERYRGFRDATDPMLAEAIAELGAEIAYLEVRAPVRAAAARGIIHGDLFRDNVLFRDGDREQPVVLIDFEQASTGSLAYDLAVLINAWCYTDELQPELVTAMVSGYRHRRELGAADAAALYVELRAAAMRFTVTRITDVYLPRPQADHGSKDFRRYLARLRRWRQLGEADLRAWAGLG